MFVIFAHSYLLNIQLGGLKIKASPINIFTEDFLSTDGAPRGAVALFFAMSGFLFFINIKKFNSFYIFYKYKLRSRINSLLIPYFFWSILWFLIVLFLQSLPLTAIFFNHQALSTLNYHQILHKIIAEPIPYQLWFIKELFILVLLSPVIYFLLYYLKYGILILLLLDYLWFGFLSHFFRDLTVLFFFIGSFLALHDNFKITPSKRVIYLVIFLWIIILTVSTLLIMNSHNNNILIKLATLLGFISLWYIYDLVPQRKLEALYTLSGFTFLIFVAHEPLLTIYKKGFLCLHLPSLLVYFISPIMTIATILIIAVPIKTHWPKAFVIMSGGR